MRRDFISGRPDRTGASLANAEREPASAAPRRARNTIVACLAATALCASPIAGATRTIGQPEGGYEAALADVTLPVSTAGLVGVPPCGGCSRMSLPVTPSTAYFVDRARVSLEALLEAAGEAEAAGRADDTAIYVFFDVETKRVNRLVLDRLDR